MTSAESPSRTVARLVSDITPLAEEPRRILERLLERLLDASQHGSTRVKDTDLEILAAPWAKDPQWSGYVGPEGSLVVLDDSGYATRSNHDIEQRLARVLASRLGRRQTLDDTRRLPLSKGLTQEQARAVEVAVNSPLCLVTGGPGTGKTTVAASIVESWLAAGISADQIFLAAPTGKAAQRLKEALGMDLDMTPTTIHRLVGLAPGRPPRHHPGDPLDARAVLIDESSMIDLATMAALLEGLHPDCNLVLLGDDRQLPSVEAGAILRDLLAADLPPLKEATVRLTVSHRMSDTDSGGRAVAALAKDFLEGRLPDLSSDPDQPVHWREDRLSVMNDWIRHWRAVREDAGDNADRLQQALAQNRLLTPVRRGRWGVEALNRLIQEEIHGSDPVGMPVMMTRNDPRQGLANGDQGIVRLLESMLVVEFPGPGGPVVVPWSLVQQDLEPSWVMTVHKSQGSECDAVTLLLPDGDNPVITRELLYTAVTRARRRVLIAGPQVVLASGLKRRLDRQTGLGFCLARQIS